MVRVIYLFLFLVSFQAIGQEQTNATLSAQDETTSQKGISNWFTDINVYPQPIYLPYQLEFTRPFTGKIQITTEEGREVLHAELENKNELMLPPSGLSGTYILRLINEETGEVYLSEQVLFKWNLGCCTSIVRLTYYHKSPKTS